MKRLINYKSKLDNYVDKLFGDTENDKLINNIKDIKNNSKSRDDKDIKKTSKLINKTEIGNGMNKLKKSYGNKNKNHGKPLPDKKTSKLIEKRRNFPTKHNKLSTVLQNTTTTTAHNHHQNHHNHHHYNSISKPPPPPPLMQQKQQIIVMTATTDETTTAAPRPAASVYEEGDDDDDDDDVEDEEESGEKDKKTKNETLDKDKHMQQPADLKAKDKNNNLEISTITEAHASSVDPNDSQVDTATATKYEFDKSRKSEMSRKSEISRKSEKGRRSTTAAAAAAAAGGDKSRKSEKTMTNSRKNTLDAHHSHKENNVVVSRKDEESISDRTSVSSMRDRNVFSEGMPVSSANERSSMNKARKPSTERESGVGIPLSDNLRNNTQNVGSEGENNNMMPNACDFQLKDYYTFLCQNNMPSDQMTAFFALQQQQLQQNIRDQQSCLYNPYMNGGGGGGSGGACCNTNTQLLQSNNTKTQSRPNSCNINNMQNQQQQQQQQQNSCCNPNMKQNNNACCMNNMQKEGVNSCNLNCIPKQESSYVGIMQQKKPIQQNAGNINNMQQEQQQQKNASNMKARNSGSIDSHHTTINNKQKNNDHQRRSKDANIDEEYQSMLKSRDRKSGGVNIMNTGLRQNVQCPQKLREQIDDPAVQKNCNLQQFQTKSPDNQCGVPPPPNSPFVFDQMLAAQHAFNYQQLNSKLYQNMKPNTVDTGCQYDISEQNLAEIRDELNNLKKHLLGCTTGIGHQQRQQQQFGTQNVQFQNMKESAAGGSPPTGAAGVMLNGGEECKNNCPFGVGGGFGPLLNQGEIASFTNGGGGGGCQKINGMGGNMPNNFVAYMIPVLSGGGGGGSGSGGVNSPQQQSRQCCCSPSQTNNCNNNDSEKFLIRKKKKSLGKKLEKNRKPVYLSDEMDTTIISSSVYDEISYRPNIDKCMVGNRFADNKSGNNNKKNNNIDGRNYANSSKNNNRNGCISDDDCDCNRTGGDRSDKYKSTELKLALVPDYECNDEGVFEKRYKWCLRGMRDVDDDDDDDFKAKNKKKESIFPTRNSPIKSSNKRDSQKRNDFDWEIEEDNDDNGDDDDRREMKKKRKQKNCFNFKLSVNSDHDRRPSRYNNNNSRKKSRPRKSRREADSPDAKEENDEEYRDYQSKQSTIKTCKPKKKKTGKAEPAANTACGANIIPSATCLCDNCRIEKMYCPSDNDDNSNNCNNNNNNCNNVVDISKWLAAENFNNSNGCHGCGGSRDRNTLSGGGESKNGIKFPNRLLVKVDKCGPPGARFETEECLGTRTDTFLYDRKQCGVQQKNTPTGHLSSFRAKKVYDSCQEFYIPVAVDRVNLFDPSYQPCGGKKNKRAINNNRSNNSNNKDGEKNINNINKSKSKKRKVLKALRNLNNNGCHGKCNSSGGSRPNRSTTGTDSGNGGASGSGMNGGGSNGGNNQKSVGRKMIVQSEYPDHMQVINGMVTKHELVRIDDCGPPGFRYTDGPCQATKTRPGLLYRNTCDDSTSHKPRNMEQATLRQLRLLSKCDEGAESAVYGRVGLYDPQYEPSCGGGGKRALKRGENSGSQGIGR